ncbi:hypothetical protein R1flu_005979 [Riccia fluitans]|uniref:Uncharacterized protein n=1 Tax=Riccia fluitans TaxID=41844 RepID=A0ABD1YUY3_9MARC
MGFTAFAHSALFLHPENTQKKFISDAHWNSVGGGGEFLAPNSVKFLNSKRKQRYETSVQRFVAQKAASRWFSSLKCGCRGECLVESSSASLQSSHIGSNSSSQQNGAFSEINQHHAAQKLGNLSREEKAGEKYHERNSSSARTSMKCVNMCRAQFGDENYFRGDSNKEPGSETPNGVGKGWKLLGGSAAVGAALKGSSYGSAHASCGGGGFGQSGSGHGGGGSWNGGGGGGGDGGHGGFDSGRGEGFIANSVFSGKNEQDERQPLPVNLVKQKRSLLASLSSAAGDFIDGEAPIGVNYASRNYPTADSFQKSETSNVQSVYPRDSNEQYQQKSLERSHNGLEGEPVFRSGAEIRPSSSSEDELKFLRRNEEFSATSSSPSYHDPSSSGKQLPSRQMYTNNYDAYQDRHPVASGYSSSFDPNTHHGFSFGPDTETALLAERNTGFMSDQVQEGTDFLGWVYGLVDSALGKKSGEHHFGTEDKLFNDEEKKDLVAETAALALKLLSEKGDEFARKFETNALRRLQREAFSDLLKVRERLDKLEHKTGLRGKTHGDSLTGARTNLRGEVSSGGAFIIAEDSACVHSRSSLQHAGLKTGLDVRFTFETPVREGDTLTTQVGVGQGSGLGDGNSFGGPLSLQKINYVAQINDSLSLSVAPLGARASDMSDTINHLQGQALTTFAGSGPALYQHCKGSAIGASLRSSSVLLSMAQFLSGWGSSTADVTPEPLCLSTLAQFMFQPCDHVVLSLSAVNNVWPSPPTLTSSGLHWSEMGPLILCKTITRPSGAFIFNPVRPQHASSVISQGTLPTESWSPGDSTRNRGIAMQSVAVAGEIDLGHRVSLAGWAQVERGDWLSEFEKKEFQWHVSLAKCTGQNVNWGLSVGRRKREDWHDDGLSAVVGDGPDDPSTSQMQTEAFVRMGCGKGFTLQSGFVYIVDRYSQTPAFMLRSSWTM